MSKSLTDTLYVQKHTYPHSNIYTIPESSCICMCDSRPATQCGYVHTHVHVACDTHTPGHLSAVALAETCPMHTVTVY